VLSVIEFDNASAAMTEYRKDAIPPEAIGDAVAYAVRADPAVDVNEIIVRPVRQR
jgi:NADP-dependent 3-hydroxy acid dehydrogenase YdfG